MVTESDQLGLFSFMARLYLYRQASHQFMSHIWMDLCIKKKKMVLEESLNIRNVKLSLHSQSSKEEMWFVHFAPSYVHHHIW